MITPAAIREAQVEPFWFHDPERHAVAMREATEPLTMEADDGQRFSGLYMNRDFTTEPAIVSPNAFMTASHTPEQMYRAYQYAAAFPEHPVLFVDMPSHGHSDNLTDAQWQEIMELCQLDGVAEAQAQAVRRQLPDAQAAIMPADSLGAQVASDMARSIGELDMQPLLLAGFDMVGMEKRSSLGVAATYFVGEAVRSRVHYHGNPAHHLLNDAFELRFRREVEKTDYEPDFKMYDVFRRDPRLLSFIVANSPLAGDNALPSLEQTLETNPQLAAALVIGGKSGICRWRRIGPSVLGLEQKFPDRLTHDVWPDDSHGMGLAPQQPRMAAYTRFVFDELFPRGPDIL